MKITACCALQEGMGGGMGAHTHAQKHTHALLLYNTAGFPQMLGKKTDMCTKEKRGSYMSCLCSHSRYFIALENCTIRTDTTGGRTKTLVDFLFGKPRPACFNKCRGA